MYIWIWETIGRSVLESKTYLTYKLIPSMSLTLLLAHSHMQSRGNIPSAHLESDQYSITSKCQDQGRQAYIRLCNE